MDYILKTINLGKYYGDFKALKNASLTIPQGAIYGLVGKNGAGKTTFIRLICGLQAPSFGTYELYGVKNTQKNLGKAQRKIGAIVENPGIYLELNAYDNLKEQCLVLGIPTLLEIPKILKLVGLENTGKKKAKNFSLGMRQRLGIGVALVGSPDFLILDEPTNGLDPQGIIEMRELILKLNHEFGITFLISSHILDELGKIATHYGFMDEGKIIKEISGTELDKITEKKYRVVVSDTKILAVVLDEMKVNYQIHSKTTGDIFGNINISHLTTAINHYGGELISLENKGENLESYFVNLLGGNFND